MRNQQAPKEWYVVQIADISIKGQQRKPNSDESFTYVDIGSIDRDSKRISTPQRLKGDDAPSRARKVINTGDVLVSLTRPNLNAVALVTEEYDEQIASTGFEVIKPINVDSRYIFALTRSNDFIDTISGVTQGALYPAAKSADVQAYTFLLPPLAEQKVIAEKLDTLLAQVEATKARLESTLETLKQFRQSVLVAAVSGELTDRWRLSNGLEKNWQELTLGDVITDGPQNGIYKPSKLYGSGTKIIRIDGFYDGELCNWGTFKRVCVEKQEEEKWALKVNDILINRVNSIEYLGKCGLVRSLPEPVIFESNIMRISLDEGKAQPEFIKIFLSSIVGLERLRANAKLAVNQASINQTDVKSCQFELPELDEQIEIIRRVNMLFKGSEETEQQVNQALERVNNLTQSILAKAFRGELTEQWRKENPELISGDNSAEALLKKIQAERAAAKPKRKARTTSA
ncbi:restriction endonuclease subunit S [Vibrio harveyi]|uniref:restriction endonuclease subunit S n=1 Tax=Vibrio harveyi TaxID=669 RepID=UPI0009BB86D0|nr:restriction endonuclease subunit S [Vibrio harveyi]